MTDFFYDNEEMNIYLLRSMEFRVCLMNTIHGDTKNYEIEYSSLSAKQLLRSAFANEQTDQSLLGVLSLRKHTYSNILKISPPEKQTESFQLKILIFFIFLFKT